MHEAAQSDAPGGDEARAMTARRRSLRRRVDAVGACRFLRLGLELALITTFAVLVVYHSKDGCRIARRSREGYPMQYSNMLCCPTPYAISSFGYAAAALAGAVGLGAKQRGSSVAAAATEALGVACCCCRRRCAAGPLAVAFCGLMLFGLAVLALFKTGGCVSYWYMHSVGSFCFFTFGFGLLFVQVFARRGDGAGCRCGARCARDLAFFAGWTRSKAIAALAGLASLGVRGADPLASEYVQIAGIFLGVAAFVRDVDVGAAALAAREAEKRERAPPEKKLDEEAPASRDDEDLRWHAVNAAAADDDDAAGDADDGFLACACVGY